jgi:hypothetical protein
MIRKLHKRLRGRLLHFTSIKIFKLCLPHEMLLLHLLEDFLFIVVPTPLSYSTFLLLLPRLVVRYRGAC